MPTATECQELQHSTTTDWAYGKPVYAIAKSDSALRLALIQSGSYWDGGYQGGGYHGGTLVRCWSSEIYGLREGETAWDQGTAAKYMYGGIWDSEYTVSVHYRQASMVVRGVLPK